MRCDGCVMEVSDWGADEADEVLRGVKREVMVDFQPPCWLPAEADRDGTAESDAGATAGVAEEEGKPNPTADEKKDALAGAGFRGGGVVTGSGRSMDRSAGGGGMGENA